MTSTLPAGEAVSSRNVEKPLSSHHIIDTKNGDILIKPSSLCSTEQDYRPCADPCTILRELPRSTEQDYNTVQFYDNRSTRDDGFKTMETENDAMKASNIIFSTFGVS
jgi:hypothetical protein